MPTQRFFNGVINNLQTQAESNRQMTQSLANQAQRGQEASRQQLAQEESVSAYVDFLNSMFSFSQAIPQADERGVEEAEREARS